MAKRPKNSGPMRQERVNAIIARITELLLDLWVEEQSDGTFPRQWLIMARRELHSFAAYIRIEENRDDRDILLIVPVADDGDDLAEHWGHLQIGDFGAARTIARIARSFMTADPAWTPENGSRPANAATNGGAFEQIG